MFDIAYHPEVGEESKVKMLSAMIHFDLKQKAETRQLRNLDLKGTSVLTAEQSRSKLVIMAKDHLNPKKSLGYTFNFIPQLIVDLCDKDLSSIDPLNFS